MSEETYRWRGINRNGQHRMGQWTIDPAELPVLTETFFMAKWRSLIVCRGPGPVPPRAVGPDDTVAAITLSLEAGDRTWWAESPATPDPDTERMAREDRKDT